MTRSDRSRPFEGRSTLRLLRRRAGCGRLTAGDADGQSKDRGADRGGTEGEGYDPEGAGGGPPRVGPGGQQMGAGRRIPGHLPAGAPCGRAGPGRFGPIAGRAGDRAGTGADRPAGAGPFGPAGKGADPEKMEPGVGIDCPALPGWCFSACPDLLHGIFLAPGQLGRAGKGLCGRERVWCI